MGPSPKTSKKVRRKIAVIMFTDIVSYSALSHHNETLALELLEEHRKYVRSCIDGHSGKEIKTVGDAFLVTFESAVDAVECAIELQTRLRDRNEKKSHEQRILLRVGIHLGDIVEKEKDVYGDGVNIASRLLHLSKPGGICVSQTVYDQIENKLDHPIKDLGAKKLKNIAKPIRVYGISLKQAPVSKLRIQFRFRRPSHAYTLASSTLAAIAAFTLVHDGHFIQSSNPVLLSPDNNRIAVLPFSNISKNPDDEYLSDGMTEELISSLSAIPQIRVLARSSVMQYKTLKKSILEIEKELKVRTLIEGTVQRENDRIRITVHASHPDTQENLWSQEYEGKINEVFKIERTIAEMIANHYKGRPISSLEPQVRPPLRNAYDFYLRGRFFINKRTDEGIQKGTDFLLKAVALDRKFSSAYAALANAYGLMHYYGYLSAEDAVEKASFYIKRALTLDPNSAEALMSLAEKKAYYDHDPKAAEEYFLKAIQSRPGYSTAHQWFGEFLASVNRIEESRREVNQALELDPMSLITNTAAALPDFYGRNYSAAVKRYLSTIEMDPNFVLPYYWLGRAYSQQRDYDRAVLAYQRAVDLSQGSPMMKSGLAYAFARAGRSEKAQSILEELLTLSRAGTKYVSPYSIATIYAGLGDKAETLRYLRKSFEEHAIQATFINVDPTFDPIRDDSRFIALQKEYLR